MGTVRAAAGGVPPPGHGAIFVAGGQGAWVALGPGSIWTSADGQTWTLAPGNGMPLRPGDRVNAVTRTAHGFIAVGASVPGGRPGQVHPADLPVGQRDQLGAARRGPAAPGRGQRPRPGHQVRGGGRQADPDRRGRRRTTRPQADRAVQAGAAWLSADGGATWAPVSGPATGHGAQPQVAGVAAVGHGFVLLRPATVARRPAVDAFSSPNGLAWTFRATLGAPAGFTALMANGGPDGAVLAGKRASPARRAGT